MSPHTEYCIVCLKEAQGMGGHVHKGDEMILAKFCTEHFNGERVKVEGCKGCYGKWSESMGLVEYKHVLKMEDFQEQLALVEARGFKPVAVSTFLTFDTYVFETDEEASRAFDVMESLPPGECVVGYWYGRNAYEIAAAEYETEFGSRPHVIWF